jgi:hypothetical protein
MLKRCLKETKVGFSKIKNLILIEQQFYIRKGQSHREDCSETQICNLKISESHRVIGVLFAFATTLKLKIVSIFQHSREYLQGIFIPVKQSFTQTDHQLGNASTIEKKINF